MFLRTFFKAFQSEICILKGSVIVERREKGRRPVSARSRRWASQKYKIQRNEIQKILNDRNT